MAERRLDWPEITGAGLLLLLLFAVCAYRLVVLTGNPAPPGSDGGNWLAFSYELLGGSVKAAEAAYPPVVPFVLWVGRGLLPALTALKAVGILSAAFAAVPAYLILRTSLRPRLAAGVAALLAVTSYGSEVFAWGGYPQHLGTAFLLFAVYFLLAGLRSGSTWQLLAGGIAAGLTVGTHLLAAVELAIAAGVILGLTALRARGSVERSDLRRLMPGLLVSLGALAVLLAVSAPAYQRMFSLLAGNPANPHGFELFGSVPAIGSWHADDYLWLALGVVSAPAALWLTLSRRRTLAADAAVAILAGAGITLLAQSEIRTVHLLQIGVLIAAGALLGATGLRDGDGMVRPGRVATSVVLIGLLLGLAVTGVRHVRVSTDWYRVVDPPALAALDWLREREEERPVDGYVLAGETERGGLYGWWVEGYAGIPAYLATDPRWLSFEGEKEQTAVANRMMAEDADPDEVRRLAEAHDIRYALIDTTAAPHAVDTLLDAGFVQDIENGRMVVLSAPREGDAE